MNFVLHNKERQFCINTSLYYPTESLWGIINKGVLLNQCKLNEYLPYFINLKFITMATRGTRYDLYKTKYIDIENFEKATGLNGKSFLESNLLNLINSHEIGSEYLKYCTKCLSVGFHSHIHQIESISKCPYHGNRLLSKCRFCQKEIKYYYSDINKKQAFSCPYCDNHLGGKGVLARDLYRSRIGLYEHFKKYEVFAEKIINNTVGHFKLSTWRTKVRDYIFIGKKRKEAEWFWGNFILEFKFEFPNLKNNKYLNIYRTNNKSSENYNLDKFKIYKSTRRYIFRRYIYKHRHCLDEHQKKYVLSQCLPGQPLSTKCAFSNAYILWRMYWEGNAQTYNWSTNKVYYLDDIENIILFEKGEINSWTEGRVFCFELFYTFIEAIYIGMAIGKCCEVSFLKSPIQEGLSPYWFAIMPQGGVETYLYAIEDKYLIDGVCCSSSRHKEEAVCNLEACPYACNRFKKEWKLYLDQIFGDWTSRRREGRFN